MPVTTPDHTGSAGAAIASRNQGTSPVIGTTLIVWRQLGEASFEIQILTDQIVTDGHTRLRATWATGPFNGAGGSPPGDVRCTLRSE